MIPIGFVYTHLRLELFKIRENIGNAPCFSCPLPLQSMPDYLELVSKLYFSLRIQATAIWKFQLKITDCDLKFEGETGLLIGGSRLVLHQRPQNWFFS